MSKRAAKPFDVSLDQFGELDEVFASNASVHIERMSETAFWIGITTAKGEQLMVNTGVHRGTWFFRVDEDSAEGLSHVVQRPRRGGAAGKARAAKKGR